MKLTRSFLAQSCGVAALAAVAWAQSPAGGAGGASGPIPTSGTGGARSGGGT
jgi:hypothetical protein